METMKPSEPDEIGELTKIVTLPESGPKGPIRLEIRKVHPAVLLAKVGSMPSFNTGAAKVDGIAMVAKLVADSAAPLAAVAGAVIVAPHFSFGDAPEEGRAWWGALSWENQLAVFNAGLEFAGLRAEVKEGSDAAAAREAVRFHGDSRRTAANRRDGVRGATGGRRARARGTGAPNARARP